ncbi:MAG: MlaD family protein [Planctomycetota bacterium]
MVARETLLGVVFFGALIGLGVLTVTLSDVSLFEKRWSYEVYFPDVKGLKSGDPVHVYGTKYGKVADVSVTSLPDDHQRVRVTLVTNRPLDLRAGTGAVEEGRYRIFVRDQTLLGGKLVEVLVGTQGNPAVAPYFGTALEEPLRAVQMLVEDNRDKLRARSPTSATCWSPSPRARAAWASSWSRRISTPTSSTYPAARWRSPMRSARTATARSHGCCTRAKRTMRLPPCSRTRTTSRSA